MFMALNQYWSVSSILCQLSYIKVNFIKLQDDFGRPFLYKFGENNGSV